MIGDTCIVMERYRNNFEAYYCSIFNIKILFKYPFDFWLILCWNKQSSLIWKMQGRSGHWLWHVSASQLFGGFLMARDTPSHHPFRTMGFSIQNHLFGGTPICSNPHSNHCETVKLWNFSVWKWWFELFPVSWGAVPAWASSCCSEDEHVRKQFSL